MTCFISGTKTPMLLTWLCPHSFCDSPSHLTHWVSFSHLLERKLIANSYRLLRG